MEFRNRLPSNFLGLTVVTTITEYAISSELIFTLAVLIVREGDGKLCGVKKLM